jgi:hypothetical protein
MVWVGIAHYNTLGEMERLLAGGRSSLNGPLLTASPADLRCVGFWDYSQIANTEFVLPFRPACTILCTAMNGSALTNREAVLVYLTGAQDAMRSAQFNLEVAFTVSRSIGHITLSSMLPRRFS